MLESRALESLHVILGFWDGNPGFCFAPQLFGVLDSFFPLSHEVAVVGTLSGLLECGKGPRFD